VIFLHKNKVVVGVTITGSSEAAGYPDGNVAEIHLSKKWRTTGDTAENIVIDLEAAVSIDAAAIVAHNLTSGATAKVQANSSDLWISPPVDVTLTWRAGIIFHTWPSGQNYRYWRFTFADASNPDTYIEIGKLLLSNGYYTLDELPNEQFTYTIEDESTVQFSITRQIYADIGPQFRQYQQGLGLLANTTRKNLIAFMEVVGVSTPFVLIPYEDDAGKLEPIYCVLKKPVGFTHQGGWWWDDDKMTFLEVK